MKQYHDLIKNEMTLLHFDQDISLILIARFLAVVATIVTKVDHGN